MSDLSQEMMFRRAGRADLETIVALFADDEFGRAREDASLPLDGRYEAAFEAIEAAPDIHLLVGEIEGELVAFLQLTFIPHLSQFGGLRGQVESVRVASHLRGRGLGQSLMHEAIRLCRERNCPMVQLTTDMRRSRTQAFYERLGFVASHHGMKLRLEARS